MSIREPKVNVACSDCGKTLKESLGLKGYHVAKHKRPDGMVCWGSKRTNHRLVEVPPGVRAQITGGTQ